ncbi:MAG: DUF1566 domain-containing protein [Nitrospirota bacterium]
MKIRRSNWVRRIGAVGLALGCLALAGLGSGATPAEAADSPTDQQSGSRFVVLEAFNNEAALDNESGLVWETIPARAATVWKNAAGICAKKTVGGKKGWRLPTVKELETLADHTIYPPPALPPGHPFSNIEFFGYWTATEHEDYTMSAWDVNFDYGIVGNDFKINKNFVWCVRDDAK